MTDYDWIKPDHPGQWSHRSVHPDTDLDHYYNASIEVGRQVLSYQDADIGLGVGFKYTDIKWTASGGSYIYSSANGFRDIRGRFGDGKVIDYRQAWPVPYVGINLERKVGDWTFGGALQAGLAVNAYDIDHHVLRNFTTRDDFDATPALSARATVDYRVWNEARLFVDGSFDKMFKVRGDVTWTASCPQTDAAIHRKAADRRLLRPLPFRRRPLRLHVG